MNILNKKYKEKKPDSKWVQIKVNTWNPEIGEKIEGKLIRIRQNNNQIIYTIETDKHKKIKIWGKTYLDELMEEIEINDYIRITYNGIQKTKNNRQMKKYKIERRIEK
ncbi:hypothetical protein PXD04_00910 [Methanosphaera sp. ISO3-F5]|uniref:hypothetical protein n=1 Tax=Methanosphaera sp. ISO3-F5 TaxID=1452353 RepID=UPI002B25A281|nr:hypothetical protein [Methanosphaera sp. ISO3-F5]WQH64387.1 hypothetical protein PXD04_00910 [Methanosphaera sp. ISO3-F5]